MKFNTNINKSEKHLYCAIRIPHINVANKTLYHLVEHIIYFGLKIPELGIFNGFPNSDFIYSATAFTDKASINICFVCSKHHKYKVINLFKSLHKKLFNINYAIMSEQKSIIQEEIINREKSDYFYWRDLILENTLENSDLGFNEIGTIKEINKISVQDVKNYLYNDKLKFDFYYSIGNKEKYIAQKLNTFSWNNSQSISFVHSSKEKKFSIVNIIPIKSKNDYIYAQIYSDYFFNINDSVLVNFLMKKFNTSDAHLETELYDNCIIYHFTVKYRNEINENNLINTIKTLFSSEIIINEHKVQREIKKFQALIAFNSYRRLYSSYLRLFKLINPHYLVTHSDYEKINLSILCKKMKSNFHEFNKYTLLK